MNTSNGWVAFLSVSSSRRAVALGVAGDAQIAVKSMKSIKASDRPLWIEPGGARSISWRRRALHLHWDAHRAGLSGHQLRTRDLGCNYVIAEPLHAM